MRRIVYFLQAIVVLFLLASCIKEDIEECPVEYTVKVYVKDKNYTNIDNVSQLVKKDESASFGTFIGTVYYQLRNLKSGMIVVESTDSQLSKNGPYYMLTFRDMPVGEYELTVWGNVLSDIQPGVLHSSETESADFYLANKKLTFIAGEQSSDIQLERTKGNLLLICSNFPADISHVELKIGSIYGVVDNQFKYTENTQVVKKVSVKPLIETVLAPTVQEELSELNLRFFSDVDLKSTNNIVFSEIPLTLKRNEITVVKADYNTLGNAWEIWININGEWKMIHHLDLLNSFSK